MVNEETAAPEQQAPGVLVTLTITLTSDGHVNVQGPIKNRILCYGILAEAHDTIMTYNMQAPAIRE